MPKDASLKIRSIKIRREDERIHISVTTFCHKCAFTHEVEVHCKKQCGNSYKALKRHICKCVVCGSQLNQKSKATSLARIKEVIYGTRK